MTSTAQAVIPAAFRASELSDRYLHALEAFCDRRGYQVVAESWTCTRRLADPRHHCGDCIDIGSFGRFGFLDHVIRLRHRDGTHYALLCQPYPGFDHDAPAAFVAEVHADRWEHTSPAPYGHGTEAVLIVGSTGEAPAPATGTAVPVELTAIVEAIPCGTPRTAVIEHIDNAMRRACRRREAWAVDYMRELIGNHDYERYVKWLNDEVPG